jgi:hypothetical protein
VRSEYRKVDHGADRPLIPDLHLDGQLGEPDPRTDRPHRGIGLAKHVLDRHRLQGLVAGRRVAQARNQVVHVAIVAIALLLATSIACTRTVIRTVPARIPCLPSEVPPVPRAEYGTAEHAEEYVLLLGAVAYVWIACQVAPAPDDAEPVGGHYAD